VTERPPDPEELFTTGGEREVLEAFVDCQRQEILRAVRGVSEADARRRLVPSMTTLAGILKHMSAVERNWFQRRLAQANPADIDGPSRGDDPSWLVGPAETVDDLIAEYDKACDLSREIAARFGLDDSVPHERLGRVSLRYIYAHMIRETARHAGHADIIRETIDGATMYELIAGLEGWEIQGWVKPWARG
jgi:uncharacterized damage-inducible protein DinB